MLLNQAKTPQQHEYTFKCRVVAKEVTYEDEQSTGVTQVTEKLVFLIPDQSTERDKFYFAWLPDTDLEPAEIVCEIGHPVFSIFRAALWRRTQHVNDFHIFVMTKGVEEILKALHDKSIVLKVLSSADDHKADTQRDWKLPYNKNKTERDGMVQTENLEE